MNIGYEALKEEAENTRKELNDHINGILQKQHNSLRGIKPYSPSDRELDSNTLTQLQSSLTGKVDAILRVEKDIKYSLFWVHDKLQDLAVKEGFQIKGGANEKHYVIEGDEINKKVLTNDDIERLRGSVDEILQRNNAQLYVDLNGSLTLKQGDMEIRITDPNIPLGRPIKLE